MSRKRRPGDDTEATEEVESEGPPPGPARTLWNQFGTLLVAVLVALSVRSCVIEPYRIPSGSMLPTLLIGDHLFVNKFIYGVKIPFTDMRLPAIREPERGDVVVFSVARLPGRIAPADQSEGGLQERFVKRVVGLPGDEVEVRGSKVWINGEPAPTRDLEQTFRDDFGNELRTLEETLRDPGPHLILDDPEKQGPHLAFEVPEGRYFMMGDNRDYSNDSRRWGTVRLAEMKGPAFIIYWSWDWNGRWRELLNPVTWWELFTDKMRWDRLGEPIR